MGQTSLRPGILFSNNLWKGHSDCRCGQSHLSSWGYCLCVLIPPWSASSLPCRVRLGLKQAGDAQASLSARKGGSQGSVCKCTGSFTVSVHTCKRFLVICHCLCHLHPGRAGACVEAPSYEACPCLATRGHHGGTCEGRTTWVRLKGRHRATSKSLGSGSRGRLGARQQRGLPQEAIC